MAVTDSDGSQMSEVDSLLAVAYSLRCRRQFDAANQLEMCVNRLRDDNLLENGCVQAALKLLLLLSKESPPSSAGLIDTHFLKLNAKSPNFVPVLPVGPLQYGDTQVRKTVVFSPFYMHYPSDIFELPGRELSTSDTYWHIDPKVFEMSPGMTIPCYSTLHNKKRDGQYAYELSKTLYGALCHRFHEPCDVHMRLEIPELGEVSSHSLVSHTRCHSSSKSQISEDEGFTEADTPVCGFPPLIGKDQMGLDVWEKVLSVEAQTHFTWENIGNIVVPNESFYLSEAGCVALDEIGMMSLQELRLLDPRRIIPAYYKVTMENLLRDTMYVMIGVPTTSFHFIASEFRFTVRDGLFLSGVSPNALRELLLEFASSGTHYARLNCFSVEPNNTRLKSGLVFCAFAEALRRYLFFHHAMVLAAKPRDTLLQLLVRTAKIRDQLKSVAELCRLGSHCNILQRKCDFPTGIRLLSYLYHHTQEAVGSELYPVLLSLLRTSCIPYLRFLQGWVYDGVCQDLYGEFPIVADDDYLVRRDSSYWMYGFSMTTVEVTRSVPLFLSNMARDIFVCGKSLDLIKLCFPQHHLCKGNSNPPVLQLTFSASQLDCVDSRSAGYVARMNKAALEKQMTWEQKELREASERMSRLENAQKELTCNMARIQKNILDARMAVEAKKRLHMADLQEQIQRTRERKKSERAKEEAEERALQAKMEEQLAEDERVARLELEQKYSFLNSDAERQRERAEWRTKRLELYAERLDFMKCEERKLTETLERRQSETSPDSETQAMEISPELDMSMEVSPDGPEINPLSLVERQTRETNTRWSTYRSTPLYEGLTSTGEDQPIVLEDIEIELMLTDNSRQTNNTADDNARIGAEETAGSNNNANIMLNRLNKPKSKTNQNDNLNANLISSAREVQNVSVISNRLPRSVVAEGNAEQDNGGVPSISEPTPSEQSVILGAKRKRGGEDTVVARQNSPKIKSRKMRPAADLLQTDVGKPGERLSSGGGKVRSTNKRNSSVIPVKKSEAQTRIAVDDKAEAANNRLSLDHNTSLPVPTPQNRSSLQSLANLDKVPELQTAENRHGMRNEHDGLAVIGSGRILNPRGRGEFGHSSDSSLQLLLYGKGKMAPSLTNLRETEKSAVSLDERPIAPTASDLIDPHSSTILRCRGRNVHGHVSDSTIQKMMYGGEKSYHFSWKSSDRTLALSSISSETVMTEGWLAKPVVFPVRPYKVDASCAVSSHLVDITRTIASLPHDRDRHYDSVHDYLPLPVIIHRSLCTPLISQINLVNKSITDLFLVELGIQRHFEALRNFILLHDGEFGQVLGDLTFNKLAMGATPAEILNPVTLNSILTKAFDACLNPDEMFTDNFSFAVRSIPKAFSMNACQAPFNCLSLHYKPSWPVNVIVTETSLAKYNEIFHFQMRIRHALWALTDIFYNLKRNVRRQKVIYSAQFNELQLYRHEMHHFVRVMQAYVANQVLQVSWEELKNNISSHVRNLDDLYVVHDMYLNRAMTKCLLHSKAIPIMKMINRILSTILKFRSDLVSWPWKPNPQTGLLEHRAHKTLCALYKTFREYANCLYGVLMNCVDRGSLLFLKELLLRLNFSDHLTGSLEEYQKKVGAARLEEKQKAASFWGGGSLERNRHLPPSSPMPRVTK